MESNSTEHALIQT
jgi:hypothetical protein